MDQSIIIIRQQFRSSVGFHYILVRFSNSLLVDLIDHHHGCLVSCWPMPEEIHKVHNLTNSESILDFLLFHVRVNVKTMQGEDIDHMVSLFLAQEQYRHK